MREMILNHASLAPAGWRDALRYLPDLADGMAALVRDRVAQPSLRMSRSLHEKYWPEEGSLFDAYQELRRQGARDQSLFLMKLSEKTPLRSGLAPDAAARFRLCEATALPAEDGAPLVLCAIADAIAVGFPVDAAWDGDRLAVDFDELLPDGTIGDAREEIDNLARASHAAPIVGRHRARLQRQCSDAADLWHRRADVFPHLTFGPEVEGQFAKLNAGWFPTLVNRLAELDETAAAWVGGDAPPWRCKVTPESESLKKYKKGKLLELRRFQTTGGERLLFEWHARFGSGARIHLRFDARTRGIEIGYVGGHLPLPP